MAIMNFIEKQAITMPSRGLASEGSYFAWCVGQYG